ncbi:uncharacterized protein ACHE_50418S [Aspergillus chevalieri]|uniref:Uncharacterized protein n=1 Tax=Aspergillus chevalieri TaxID=182096 RepID=A0A7R7VQZ9_ASPCH|nr:uncharacterized protein ACHE_50418S [Aspergillus chevalieri]BCR89220.1 hypothetical protein ACHE_50418S [Aspergillus chevalieri]
MVLLAANAASRGAGAGPGVVIVPALCALFYAGPGGFMLDWCVLAEELDPFGHCLNLSFWDCHDKGARQRILI